MQSAMIVTKDATKNLEDALKSLTAKKVFVGIPQDDNARADDASFGNASIGYVNEFGSAAANIPPRPHLIPGVQQAQKKISDIFMNGGKAALAGNRQAAEDSLVAAGLVAVASVKRYITDGLSPPLAESTLEARARRGRKGAIAELSNRASGKAPSSDLAKPLIDTGEYRNAITYVIREE